MCGIEQEYSSAEGKALAVVKSIQHFRPYLYGKKFLLQTDHAALKWLMTTTKLTGKLARWALELQSYDFEILYKKGVNNGNADGLSRLRVSPIVSRLTEKDLSDIAAASDPYRKDLFPAKDTQSYSNEEGQILEVPEEPHYSNQPEEVEPGDSKNDATQMIEIHPPPINHKKGFEDLEDEDFLAESLPMINIFTFEFEDEEEEQDTGDKLFCEPNLSALPTR